MNTHQFAFYTPQLSHIAEHFSHLDIHELTDTELVHRIGSVLRLNLGEAIILFDSNYHSNATILGIQLKKTITVELHSLESNTSLKPTITWVLPLLKRDAFEEALYALTELGAQIIQPVLSQKISKMWWSEKEIVRSKRIMIAAAEQSKQFILPVLLPLISFDRWLFQIPQQSTKIFFDPAGITLKEALPSLDVPEIIACTGPEGDLTNEEKALLKEHNFMFCKLTKTILRAQQAVTIGLGILRSLL